jgi:hypothetical protein
MFEGWSFWEKLGLTLNVLAGLFCWYLIIKVIMLIIRL